MSKPLQTLRNSRLFMRSKLPIIILTVCLFLYALFSILALALLMGDDTNRTLVTVVIALSKVDLVMIYLSILWLVVRNIKPVVK